MYVCLDGASQIVVDSPERVRHVCVGVESGNAHYEISRRVRAVLQRWTLGLIFDGERQANVELAIAPHQRKNGLAACGEAVCLEPVATCGPAESNSALIDRVGPDIGKTLVSYISEHFH